MKLPWGYLLLASSVERPAMVVSAEDLEASCQTEVSLQQQFSTCCILSWGLVVFLKVAGAKNCEIKGGPL